MLWQSIWKDGTGPVRLSLFLLLFGADSCFCTDVGTLGTHKWGQQAEVGDQISPDPSVVLHWRCQGSTRWDMLRPAQPTRQFFGPSILCTMHARHAEICDSCGQRAETFGQSWQLERRDRWSRAHPIESCMREGFDWAKASYYHHNAEIQHMTPIRAACWCLKRVNTLEKHWPMRTHGITQFIVNPGPQVAWLFNK